MNSNHKPRHNQKSGRHNNNKQNNRNRNQGGRNNGRKGPSRSHTQQPLTATRQIDSHGPAGKLRGNVKQLYDRYKELALEERTRDRQASEAYGQYAHHYYTLYTEFAAAEAADAMEKEKEAKRKREVEAENKSNQTNNKDDTSRDDIKNDDTSGNDIKDVMIAAENIPFLGEPEVLEKPKADEPKSKPEPEQSAQDSLELPLDKVEADVKPKRKPAVRKPKKVKVAIKEDVAE